MAFDLLFKKSRNVCFLFMRWCFFKILTTMHGSFPSSTSSPSSRGGRPFPSFEAWVLGREYITSCSWHFLLFMILTFFSASSLAKFGFDLGIPFLCDFQSPAGLPYFNTSPGVA